tara:strand:+ start:910 stop:1116 length:207 start_codon:yes stop_codon:yes gene_type:complete
MNKKSALILIERHRQRQALTVSEAARRSIITQPNWSRIQHGLQEPTWDTLIGMGKAVGLNMEVTVKAD